MMRREGYYTQEKQVLPYSRMRDEDADRIIREKVDIQKLSWILERFYSGSGSDFLANIPRDELFSKGEIEFQEGYFQWLSENMDRPVDERMYALHESAAYAMARVIVELQEKMDRYDLLVIEGRGALIPGMILQEVFEGARGIVPAEGRDAREQDWAFIRERGKKKTTREDSEKLIDALLVPSIERYNTAEVMNRSFDALGDRTVRRALLVSDVLYLGVTASGVSSLLTKRSIPHDVASVVTAEEANDYMGRGLFDDVRQQDPSFALVYGMRSSNRSLWSYFSRLGKRYPVVRRTDDEKHKEYEHLFDSVVTQQETRRKIAKRWTGQKIGHAYLEQSKDRQSGGVRIIPVADKEFEQNYRQFFYYGLQLMSREFSKLVKEK